MNYWDIFFSLRVEQGIVCVGKRGWVLAPLQSPVQGIGEHFYVLSVQYRDLCSVSWGCWAQRNWASSLSSSDKSRKLQWSGFDPSCIGRTESFTSLFTEDFCRSVCSCAGQICFQPEALIANLYLGVIFCFYPHKTRTKSNSFIREKNRRMILQGCPCPETHVTSAS